MEKFYTINEVASILKVSTKTVRRLEQSGQLIHHHLGAHGTKYFSEQQIARVQSGDVQPGQNVQSVQSDVQSVQSDVQSVQSDVQSVQSDVQSMSNLNVQSEQNVQSVSNLNVQSEQNVQSVSNLNVQSVQSGSNVQSENVQSEPTEPQTDNLQPQIVTPNGDNATAEIKKTPDFFQNTQTFLQNGQSEKIKTAHREAAISQDKNTTSKQKSKDPAANIPASHFKPKKKAFSYSDWIRQRKELAEQAKPLITNLLYELGVENLSRNFHCINPTHNDSTPSMTYYADTHCVHCHGCGFHGNIFNVYSAVHNMPINKALFDEVFAKYGLIDIVGGNTKIKKRPKLAPVEPPKDAKKELVDRSADINAAIANIHLTDYWAKRSFNLDTVQHFRIGYAPQWKHPDFNTPPSDRLILPTGDGVSSYLARDVHNDGNFKVLKVGGSQLFNPEGLNSDYIIVNEGEFDAVSTFQVGFHNVVGLGGVGNKDKFVEAVAALTVKPKFVIIALDNDKPGLDAAHWIHEQLEKLQIYSVIINEVFGDNKDANNLLQRDSDALKAIYDKAIEQAQADYSNYQFPIEENAENVDDDADYSTSEVDLFYLPDDILEDLMYLPFTDAGNAERLIEAYGERLIFYLTDSGRWLNFNGCQWFKAADSANNSVTSMVTNMARQLRTFAKKQEVEQKAVFDSFIQSSEGSVISIDALEGEAKKQAQDAWDNYNIAKAAASFSRRLEKRTDIDNSIYLAKGYSNIRITNEDLNTHKTLLNCPNGVVDLETGKLMQHDSSLLITQCTNAYYIPNYHNELLERTLHQIIPDEETFDQFFLFLAYGLTGLTDEEKAAFIRGRGGNGKGTVTKLLMKALGNYAVTLPADILLMASYLRDGNAPTPELAKLEFIRLAICDEIPPGRKMDIAKFKWLTGSDFLSVRELHRDPRMIDPMFKLILSGNHLPEIDDANDVAIKRRLIVYPFTQDFTQTGDPKLKNELMNQDPINGLMTLLVNYCTRYFKEGLGVSAAMQQARDEYLEDNDSIGQFIAENCDFDADSSIQRKDFIERIRRSGVVSGMTDKSIIDAVNKINGITYKKSSNDGGARRFFGIKWRDNNPSLEIVSPPNDSDNPF